MRQKFQWFSQYNLKTILSAVLILQFAVPSLVFAQESTPFAQDGSEVSIYGPAYEMLPVGVSEEVELVAIGDFNGSLIPVIVQNNTEEIVYEIEVKVDVRDASGSLVAVGQSQSTHAIKPHVVLPDEYAFGWIFLDVPSIEGMDLKYNVNYEDEPGIFASSLVSLDFGELNWVDDRIVGEVINPSDEDLRGVWMNVVCVDSSGLPVAVEIHHIPDISAKEIITFQVTGGIFGDLTKCEHFAITGEARP